jgi:(1->4)-alpha-D-glucan 1-alpha-D-glucosylmutase
MTVPLPSRLPVSTYRLQFNKTFSLDDAARVTPYLSDLGISEIYASPILMAAEGSMHGYDICDHSRINPEIGGSEALERMSGELVSRSMGLILDFVPNHMGINACANAWWRDVLENGPSSQYARFFDIDWTPLKRELHGKVLLPILGEQYGVALDSGKLQIQLSNNGLFTLRYYDRDLPLNTRELSILLGHNLDKLKTDFPADDSQLSEFLSILFHLEHLPPYQQTDMTSVSERSREKVVVNRRLASLMTESSGIRQHVEGNIREFNGTPGEPGTFDLLHSMLEKQAYRLSSWRTATQEINYRRFFDINELAAIRMEDAEVFDATHILVLRLIREGIINGLRLDHVDGLFDPRGYFDRLHQAVGPDRRIYVTVEKILSEGERLPEDWAVHGTTGYDFMTALNSIYVDRGAAREFQKLYGRITGGRRSFKEVVYSSKKLIVETSMASEMHVLAHELNRISESDRHYRDFTLISLQEALTEVVSCFPVYRTYVSANGLNEFDKRNIDLAIREALRRNPAQESSIFRFIRKMLLPVARPDLASEEHGRRLRFAMKVQQYTGPVQAKGVEDTAFYRYSPLLSLNEVGGHPTQFGISLEEFHAMNHERLEHYPLAMSASSTHDAKRGEDARARLNVLSEIPKLWDQQVKLWMRINSSARITVEDDWAPDRSDEYIYYQALLGAWPAGEDCASSEFVDRMRQYLSKATKEKKVHTSWVTPSAEYDAAVAEFVERTLMGTRSKPFLAQFLPFQRRVAELGMINSLSQLTVKIASPGVPDFYQGTELWDLNLVDPDNRRPVDFTLHSRMLEKISAKVTERSPCCAKLAVASELLGGWMNGGIKLYITSQGLRLRRRKANLFLFGEYKPLMSYGSAAGSVVAFARASGDDSMLAVAPRLTANLTGFDSGLPLNSVWSDTELDLGEFASRTWRNIFTGQKIAAGQNGRMRLAELFEKFPVALLTSGDEG